MRLNADDRLLLALARPRVREADAARAGAAVAEGVDWDYVLDASVRHAVAPLLAGGLEQALAARALAPAAVPGAVHRELVRLLDHSRDRSRRLFATVGDVVGLLHAKGVPVVGLKDLQLAVEVYPDRGLRPMGDVDLLVHPEDWDVTASCLAVLGFEPQPGAERPSTRRYAVGQQFRRAADETWIDLQWHVAEREWDRAGEGRYTFATDRLWERAVPLPVDGYELLAPCPEDMLVHLCVHLEGHAYCELVLLCDIVAFLERYGPTFDWDALAATAHRSGMASAVYHVLFLTGRLFDVELPEEALAALRPPYFRAALDEPLFGNLNSLHPALDDLRPVATAAPELLPRLEAVVREQAALAMRIEAELDDLAAAFVAAGGTSLVFAGLPSPRQFPDPAVPPFGPLELFVDSTDAPVLRRALAERGFQGGAATRSKQLAVRSADPALAGRTVEATLAVVLDADTGAAVDQGGAAGSNRAAAARSLLVRAGRAPAADGTVAVTAHVLPRTDLLVVLATRIGRREDGQLFGVCPVVGLTRERGIDGPAVLRRAGELGVAGDAARGLAILAGVCGDGILAGPAPALPPAPHILTWARYGPTALSVLPELREAYLWVLCALLRPGAAAKAAFVARSTRPRPGAPAVLPALAAAAAQGCARALVGRRRSANDLAYWARPLPDAATVA